MTPKVHCSQCGEFLTEDVLQGLCRRCVAQRMGAVLSGLGSPAAPGSFLSLTEFGSKLIGGRYRLGRVIGEGGFGAVFLAEQTAPIERQVALKVLKPGMDSRQVVARFELERQTLALMDHPGIAKVLDAGMTESGRPFFAMELVRGAPITEYCQAHELSVRQRLQLFVEVCQAVQHAHQKGIIHRDLKPSNILVAIVDKVAVPKVIDFGIAKALTQELTPQTLLTHENQLLGTPAYISPEQASLGSADIDTRSDIYSLGVLLYELLTGVTPIDTKALARSGFEELRRAIQEKEPLRPSLRLAQLLASRPPEDGSSVQTRHAAPRIDRDLDCIVLKCLQKGRVARYATANGLAMDIQRYLANEPIAARPPSRIYRVTKLVRRNPVVTSLVTLLIAGVTVAFIAGAVVNVRLARAKNEADHANQRLSRALRYLESENLERLAGEGRRSRLLAWLAHSVRQSPNDLGAASRALSMLSLHNYALPAGPPLVHDGPVNMAWFSPDGTQIATASDDGTTRFWESRTGQLAHVNTNAAGALGVWYVAGGKRVLVWERDARLRVLDSSNFATVFEISHLQREAFAAADTPGGAWLYAVRQDQSLARWNLLSDGPPEPVLQLTNTAFMMRASDRGDCVALASDDGAVQLLAASTGQALWPPRRFSHRVSNLRFPPDGQRLFISLQDGKPLAIWDFHRTNVVSEFDPPPPIKMKVLQFSPDGRRLVSSAWAVKPRVWALPALELLNEPIGSDSPGWSEYSVSGDSKLLAGITQDGIVRVWDLETGQPAFEPLQHQGWVRSAHFNRDNTQLLTASQDGTARLWDIRMRQPRQFPLPFARGGVVASPNDGGTRALVSVDVDAVQVCDLSSGAPISPLLKHPSGSGEIRQASFSHDDSRFLTLGREGLIRIWNAQSYRLEHEIAVGRSLVLARFSQDDRLIVVGDRSGHATIWSTETGAQLGAVAAHHDEIVSLEIHPRNEAFITASADGTARCWTLPTGAPASPPLQHRGIVWSARYSPDGELILTASAEHRALLWDARTGRRLPTALNHEKDVLSACFSPDGRWVLTTSDDRTARVWSTETGEPVSPPLRHASKIWTGAFSPDGRWVATGADDKIARLWDPKSGLPLSEPLPHPGPLVRLSFCSNGQQLLTFGGQPKFWQVLIAPSPVPSWFCDLLEAVAGYRLDSDGQVRTLPPHAFHALQIPEAASGEDDFYVRWAKWFLIDRRQDPAPLCPRP